MPITVRHDNTTGELMIEGTGVFASADLLAFEAAIHEYATEGAPVGVLADLSGVMGVSVSTEDMSAAARRMREFEPALGLNLAMVASTTEVFGMARMYELRRDDGDRVRVFHDRGSALEWLRHTAVSTTEDR